MLDNKLISDFYWLLSFVRISDYVGEQDEFLGAIILLAPDEQSAITKSHLLNINPGGEVQFYQLDTEAAIKIIKPEYLDKLLNKEQLTQYGLIS